MVQETRVRVIAGPDCEQVYRVQTLVCVWAGTDRGSKLIKFVLYTPVIRALSYRRQINNSRS